MGSDMTGRGNYMLAGATFMVALALGFVMQNRDAFAARFVEADAKATPHMPADHANAASALPQMEPPLLRIASLAPSTVGDYSDPTPPEFALSCEASVTTQAAPDAMVQLHVQAPCHKDMPLTIEHAGISASFTTGPDGQADITFPALQPQAQFAVMLAGHPPMTAQIDLPEAAETRRLALSWQGTAALSLIAALDQGPAQTLRLGTGNDSGQHVAEVYTLNPDQVPTDVRVLATVTKTTCNSRLAANAVQVDALGTLHQMDLNITVPACDAIGEHLVLNKLFQNLTIAQR